MERSEYINILKQGVEIWNEWRLKNPKLIPNLEKITKNKLILRSASLRGIDLRYSDLRNSDLSGIDLRYSNLRSVKLKGSDLSDSDLRGADLSNSDLSNSDLSGIYLSDVDLRDSNLRSADLSNANLSDANLINANLRGVDLSDANLSDTNFNSVILGQTLFFHTNLKDALNLDKIRHTSQSSLDSKSIQKVWKLPIKFLRGVGLSDYEIKALNLLNPEINDTQVVDLTDKIYHLRSSGVIQYYSCFISYSHTDKEFAKKLNDNLQERGIRIWLDEHQLLPGENIIDGVDRGIKVYDKVILICSKSSLNSWWVDNEIDKAIEKEKQLWRKNKKKTNAIIPIDIDGFIRNGNWDDGKKNQITNRVIESFEGWKNPGFNFSERLDRIIKALVPGKISKKPDPIPKI